MRRSQPGQGLQNLLLVATGAIPGALLRWHWSGGWSGTLAANLLAALVLGSLLPLQQRHPRLLLLLGVGFCGSLSTFSTWMLDLKNALLDSRPPGALVVLLSHLLGGLLAISLGASLSRWWLGRRRRTDQRFDPIRGGRSDRSGT